MYSFVIIRIFWSYLTHCASEWFLFKKYGEPGWKAIIPCYNYIVEFEKVWDSRIIIGSYIALILTGIVFLINPTAGYILFTISIIVIGILFIIFLHKKSKAFGQNARMTVVLLLFPLIGNLVLGLGKAKFMESEEANSEFLYFN